jgi:GNAT superfamily N-acetyltransferase
MQLIEVDNVDAGTIVLEDALPATVGSGDAAYCRPDARWVATAPSAAESRCSLWWRNTPKMGEHRVGIIGHYVGGGDKTANVLLEHACRELRSRGCTVAVGPMDGNTWSDYRFVVGFGSEPRFWLEPANPPEWPRQFLRSKFQTLAQYFSALTLRLDFQARNLDHVRKRLHVTGVRLRPVSEQSFDYDIRQIHDVARIAFRNNLLYSDLSEYEFIDQTRPLRRLAPLELSWIAEHLGRPVGFLFCVPDLLEAARIGRSDTVIIKTLAVIPDHAYAGLGTSLLAHVQQHALELGYSRAIHALVRNVASLRRLSGRFARPFRNYTLFAKTLTP